MGRNHFWKYSQKYHIFFSLATAIMFLLGCNTTKKVPDGEYLLTKNKFVYQDGKIFEKIVPNYVKQKPNKKILFFIPFSLSLYNAANPKYDSILNEYGTYPSDMRNQKLRDSLFIKYKHPEYIGKNLFMDRVLHNYGKAPVILDNTKTQASASAIKKQLIYRGYWDSEVKFEEKRDSISKKAEVTYLITHKDSTVIKDYYYDITDPKIKAIYAEDLTKSKIRSSEILDQTKLEAEVKRINQLMKDRGYYRFNNSNQEISFIADTLSSRKLVPLTMEIHNDSSKVATIGNIKVAVVYDEKDFPKNTTKDSLMGVNFYKINDLYKTKALWRAIVLKKGERYDQKTLDLTKRNLIGMNNFAIQASDDWAKNKDGSVSDSIVDVTYILKPLPKYNTKQAIDVNWSQILNFSAIPSFDLTTRNVFGGAENLSTSISGTFGSVSNPKDVNKRLFAYEISAQGSLKFPRLFFPFNSYKLVPKSYSPTSSINLGISTQQNIGMGRVTFNFGLNYLLNVNDVVSHRLSLFNTQLSLTQNKDNYYNFFSQEAIIRNDMFSLYSPTLYDDFNQGLITSDELSQTIINDTGFTSSLTGSNLDLYNNFLQSLINKDRQTQDVLISSLIYNFTYNEIGKKEFVNPFFFSGNIEFSGNILSLLKPKTTETGITTGEQRTVLNVPFSQFIKFDLDFRKHFTFGKNTLALRQFIGIGIPYGNSSSMPFIRSYFNGGSNDIRAWRAFGGLGPADSQLDVRVRNYIMDNVKLTSSIEYRFPFSDMFEGAIFTDAGNIWSLKDNGFGDQFKLNKFLSQLGVGSGLGLRINVAYITLRLDLAYKLHDPNQPIGQRWQFRNFNLFKPTFNIAFGFPF